MSLEADGRQLTGRATQRRRLALLALLAVARERGMTRDKVLAFLWPERDPENARHTLSQTLYAIRQDLGDEAVLIGVDDLRLNPSVLASDVEEFEEALVAGRREDAVRVYAGAFLDGFFVSEAPEFERWVDGERQRLANAYGAALVALAEEAASRAQHAQAVAWWRKRAALEPLNSHVAVRLMSALAQAGDRAGAVQQARVHTALLRQDLDVGPDPAVTALAEQLRKTPVPEPRTTTPAPRTAAPATTAPPRGADERGAAVGAATPPGVGPGRRLIVTGTIAALAVAGAITFARSHGPGSPVLRPVVLGAIAGPDPALGLAVGEALRAELESEGGIRVLGEARVRQTLELMRVPPDTALGAPLALELAQRRGAPLVIVGSATPLGTGAQLVAQLLDAQTGEPIATLSERPAAAEDIVPAVARLAAALRGHAVGARVAAATQPLPPVTTASLAALRNYAQARQALSRLDRPTAIALLEAAVAHDSLFALAHYLVGDVLWYVDQYSHSVAHLTTALRLSDRLPARERLIVKARHEQLVRDRVDSALAYWQQVRASYPDEPLAFEGVVWNYIALERFADVAAVAETAQMLSPVSPDIVRFRYTALIDIGDTLGALRVARGALAIIPNAEFNVRLALLERRGDWDEALRVIDSATPGPAADHPRQGGSYARHLYLLGLGRLEEARREMEAIVAAQWMQNPHRALLLQAHAEVGWRGATAQAKELVRRGFARIEASDIYPPAVARLTELAATAAARIGDTATIAAVRRHLLARDGGRELHSLRVALLTTEACAAFARGEMRRAAELAARSRSEKFHGHSRAAVALLEADARAAIGDRARADSLYREIASIGSVWQPFARRALERR